MCKRKFAFATKIKIENNETSRQMRQNSPKFEIQNKIQTKIKNYQQPSPGNQRRKKQQIVHSRMEPKQHATGLNSQTEVKANQNKTNKATHHKK